jgi:hypothetical protein
VRADHERPCPAAAIVEERGRLYAGLYDGRRAPGPTVTRIRFLGSRPVEDDPVSRRFALLEVD